MFTIEDYKLMDRMIKIAIEKVDTDLYNQLVMLRVRIGNELAVDDSEKQKLFAYLHMKVHGPK